MSIRDIICVGHLHGCVSVKIDGEWVFIKKNQSATLVWMADGSPALSVLEKDAFPFGSSKGLDRMFDLAFE